MGGSGLKLKSKCFLTNCERARTMKKLCVLIEKDKNHWIVEVKGNPSEKYFALPHHIRAPIKGETDVRLFD